MWCDECVVCKKNEKLQQQQQKKPNKNCSDHISTYIFQIMYFCRMLTYDGELIDTVLLNCSDVDAP